MGDFEVQSLKQDVAEIRSDLKTMATKDDVAELKTGFKEMSDGFSDMRVLIAGNYVTKDEFEKHKEDEKGSRRYLGTYILAAATVLLGIINVIMLIRKG